MQKILFIIGNLDSGGVAKSIVNLLNVVDVQRYEVCLLVLSDTKGPFEQFIPADVRIIRDETMAAVIGGVGGLKCLVMRGHLLLALGSILRMVISLFSKSRAGILLSKLLPAVEGEYDMIVDYNGQAQLYYMVDKLKAKRKVTFFHNDYKKWPYYEAADRKYFPKVDKIFTISQQCVQSLKEVFPKVADKISLMENISSPNVIYKQSKDGIDTVNTKGVLLLTVAHVCFRKGFDYAFEAATILKSRNIEFTWLFLGSISKEVSPYTDLIKEKGLSENIIFLGIKSNPYPYMEKADIIVHPSRYEGKSITLDEAKILCKPIVVTNFSTVHDQFEDGVNATICEMNGESVADAIATLIKDNTLRDAYISYLHEHTVDNSNEVQKLYQLLEA